VLVPQAEFHVMDFIHLILSGSLFASYDLICFSLNLCTHIYIYIYINVTLQNLWAKKQLITETSVIARDLACFYISVVEFI
jgi:hypothetical protein